MLFHGGGVESTLGTMWSAPVFPATGTKADVHRMKQGCDCCTSHILLAMMASIFPITFSITMVNGKNIYPL
jgi:hypothetical protein